MNDLREWLLDRIDGGEEMRGEDGLISDFIRQIDAATAELSDLKQRLLPQFQGRTQKAEHERDALLEQLIAARSATAATQDAQAIVASCCAAFDCRPSELLGMIRDLKGRDMKGEQSNQQGILDGSHHDAGEKP